MRVVSEYLASIWVKSESAVHKNLTPSSLNTLMLRLGSHHPPILSLNIGRILTGPRASTSLCSGPAPGSPGSLHVNMKLVYAKHATPLA